MQCFTIRLARLWQAAALVVAVAAGSTIVRANSGVLLPLNQYQGGTEQVQNTIVSNGGFEATTGSLPNNWSLVGTSSMQSSSVLIPPPASASSERTWPKHWGWRQDETTGSRCVPAAL